MKEAIELIEITKFIQTNMYLLTFLLLYAVGWYMKECTDWDNRYIVPTLWFIGGGLGFILISRNIVGVILGIIMATLIIGGYESWKNLGGLMFDNWFKWLRKD